MELDDYILLIYKELKGEISPEEQATLLQHKGLSAENQKVYSEVEKSWEGTLISNAEVETDLNKLNETIGTSEPKIVSLMPKFLRVAALLVVTVTATLFIYQRLADKDQVYYAAEDMELTLADGSKVSMLKGSTLSHGRKFKKDRLVNLTGTAFFEVQPDTARRFLILASGAKVEVLGTSFTVDDSGDDVVVSVKEGSVKLSTDDSAVILRENQVGVIDMNLNITKNDMNFTNFDYWINGQFRFENEKLFDVFEQLSLIFDIDIEISKTEMMNCPMSGVFNERDGVSLVKKIADKFGLEVQEESPSRFILLNGQCN